MTENIHELEKIARQLEVDDTTKSEWLDHVDAYTSSFLDNLANAPTFIYNHERSEGLLDFPIQDGPREMNTLVSALQQYVDGVGLMPASAGHLGYIPGGGIFPTALGDYIADVTNHYAGIYFGGPGAVRMEHLLVRWMCDLMGYPETALGNLTSGGSIATLIAIATARDSMNIKCADISTAVIYLSNQAHHSIQKAIRIAGLEEALLREIPIDEAFRMDANALARALDEDRANGLQPFLIVASAGTTDTGAIDPLEEIAELSKAFQCWLHVDAAYGGFFILAEEKKEAFKGIEQSDSITIDPHKGLFLSYGTGAVLIKDVAAQQHTHFYQANYMQDTQNTSGEYSPADLSPELTKHWRGMRMWLPLQLFGLQPFKAALSEKIWLCRYFYEAIKELGFEVGPYPDLSVMIYRYAPEQEDVNNFNERLVRAVQEDGRVFISSTTLSGTFWIRLAVLCFRTHLQTIKQCLEVLELERDKLLEKG